MGNLGDGLRAMRALATKEHPALAEHAKLREKLSDELSWEAQKFLVYRTCRMRDRELLSVHRMRSLCELLKHAA